MTPNPRLLCSDMEMHNLTPSFNINSTRTDNPEVYLGDSTLLLHPPLPSVSMTQLAL
jgi:hypothetical protein